MRQLFVTLFMLVSLSANTYAATFKGTATATFYVQEYLDGTPTTVAKVAPLDVTLTTDYSTLNWSLNWNTTIVMAGGPTQPFETDLTTSGSVFSTRCTSGTACLNAIGAPSPLTFPDSSGRAGAGNSIFYGTAGWSLTDRVVSSSRTRTSPTLTIASGRVTGTAQPVTGTTLQYLTVADYPNSISLLTQTSGTASWQDGLGTGSWHQDAATIALGHIGLGTNDDLSVSIGSLSSSINLTEVLTGDFNSSQTVSAADYVLFRDAPGPLAPFLTSYSAWRSNFGNSIAGLGASEVPEPCALRLLALLSLALSCQARNRAV